MGTPLPPATRSASTGGMDDAARIDIVGLTKRYVTPKGESFTAIDDVTFAVEPGQFCAIVGPTGCGKSTTLAQVSGLERPSEGHVLVGGQRVDGITSGVSYMFQADSLFPWKTVLGNVMMGPILLGTPTSQVASWRWPCTCRKSSKSVSRCVVAGIGLLPAAVSSGIGSQVQKPLAVVVVAGMMLAPVVILVTLPALISMFSRRSRTGLAAQGHLAPAE